MAASRSHKAQTSATPPADSAADRSTAGQGGGVLYVVATPIGNLGDFSARGIATLKAVNAIACEDTRVTGGLLQRFGITTRMMAYHDHNADRIRPLIVARLAAGESIALVSDAGTPLISDPGFKLVKDCIAHGLSVCPVPGPSAPVAALMAAGLPTDRFYFGGFLPSKSKARKTELDVVKSLAATLIFFESPHRLAETLSDMAAVFGPREAVIAREITRLHEEFRRGPLTDLAAHYQNHDARGEIVIAVMGATESGGDEAPDLDALLDAALKSLSLRDAADAVSKSTGASRREVYARALALSKKAAPKAE